MKTMLVPVSCLLALTALSALPGAARAQTSVPTGIKPDLSVTATSDYRFRGVSQSDRSPAIQLTGNLTHASGVYVGTFVSTIGRYIVDGADPEIDLYAGVRRTILGTAVDAGLLYYVYPGTNGFKGDYFEPYASATRTIGPLSAKLGGNFSWKQRGLGLEPGEKLPGIYAYGEAALAVPRTPVTVTAHVGHSFHATYATFGAKYTDWGLTAAYVYKRLTFSVGYVDTDTRIESYPNDRANHDVAGAGVVGSVALAVF